MLAGRAAATTRVDVGRVMDLLGQHRLRRMMSAGCRWLRGMKIQTVRNPRRCNRQCRDHQHHPCQQAHQGARAA